LAAAQEITSVSCAPEAQPLIAGKPIKCHMDAGATHVYELNLTTNQFTQIVLEQKGVDVEVKVYSPDGALYALTDNPNGFYGRESASILAVVGGTYRLEISSDKSYPAGDYELKREATSEASEADKKRVNAEHSFAEAQQLRSDARKKPSRDETIATYQAAISKYQEALAIWTELDDLRGQGYALTNAGRAYKAIQQISPALDNLDKALSCLRKAGDTAGLAFTLNEKGAIQREFGDLRQALTTYTEALKLRLELADRYGQAQIYNNLGLTYSYIGYQPQAVENLEKAMDLWHELNLPDSELKSRINAAKARIEMGDLDLALSHYETVRDECKRVLTNPESPLTETAKFLMPFSLNGIGLVYSTWAESDKARVNYKAALDWIRQNKRKGDFDSNEADVLDNLGMHHAFLGDSSQAMNYFQEALLIREQLKQPKPLGMTLSNMGYAYTLQGKYREALSQLSAALQLSQSSGDKRFEAYTLIRRGMAYVDLQEPRKALESYEAALAIQQDPQFEDRRGLAITLDKMGEALRLSGELPQAFQRYEQAIERWNNIGDSQGRALSLYGIARVERDRGNLANARDRAEEAIQIVEQLRNRVSGRELQMTYFASKQNFYELAIDVRMQLYHFSQSSSADLAAAISLSERARARNLIDLLTQARIDPYKGMSSEDAKTNLQLQRQIDELTQSSLRFRNRGAKESADIVERLLLQRMAEQDALLSAARTANHNSSRSVGIQPLTASQIQNLLDDDTVLLECSLGNERSHLFAVTRQEISYYSLPAESDIRKKVEEFLKLIATHEPRRDGQSIKQYTDEWKAAEKNYQSVVTTLSDVILRPVWTKLGQKRVVIVADGPLQYIPFEILPVSDESSTDNRTPRPTLIATNEIVYEPSASTLALLRTIPRPTATRKTIAVIADPVFTNDAKGNLPASETDDGSSSAISLKSLARSLRDVGETAQGDFALSRLEYSRAEADAITSIARPGTFKRVLGFDANRAVVMSPILKRYDIVHFATHGILNDKHPDLSGIVLSMVNERNQLQDGFLTLRDIYRLDLPIHLVVLSACRTGVGQAVRGEGLIGLTRGFMYAGAKSVVVSLWRVDDKATAELMKRFYWYMLRANLPAAAALARAKVKMRSQPEWRSAYFWAGFVLQGDWK